MPLTRLDRIGHVDVDVGREVDRLAAHTGMPAVPAGALGAAHRTYRNMKTLGFFQSVAGTFHNRERLSETSGRTSDIFLADLGRGPVFVVVEASYEAAEAFLDDGQILLKLREWLEESLRRVVDAKGDPAPPREKWGIQLYGPGSRLPRGVKAIPFFTREFAPGIPALTLVLVKPTEADSGNPEGKRA